MCKGSKSDQRYQDAQADEPRRFGGKAATLQLERIEWRGFGPIRSRSALEPVGCDIEDPGDDDDDRQSEDGHDDKRLEPYIGNPEHRDNGVRDLDDGPRRNEVNAGHTKDVPAFEFPEEALQAHGDAFLAAWRQDDANYVAARIYLCQRALSLRPASKVSTPRGLQWLCPAGLIQP